MDERSLSDALDLIARLKAARHADAAHLSEVCAEADRLREQVVHLMRENAVANAIARGKGQIKPPA